MQKIRSLKQIETPRLIIRPVQIGDEIQLNSAINNSLTSLQKWMPWASDPSLEATRNFVQNGVSARTSDTMSEFPMVIIHKEGKKIIGGSGYNDGSRPEEGLYEIGYWCDIDYRGKGYVTECVNALARYTFDELQAQTVALRIKTGNIKSIAIAQRLRFENQGIYALDDPTDYYFTCKTPSNLPLLEVSWKY